MTSNGAPTAMVSCITTLGEDVNTASTTVTEMCAGSSTPCPAALTQGDPDLLSSAPRAPMAAAAVAAMLLSLLL